MFRGFLGLVATLIVVGLLVSVGAGVYQAGVTQGVIDAGRFPAGAAVPIAGYGYGYGFHGGPGIFGLLFGLFFLFILIGIIRAAFFGGRGRGWGHHGYGYGRGPWGRGGFGPGGPGAGGGPDAWRDERDERIADWHRRLHEEEAAGRSGGAGAGSGATPGYGSGSGSGTGTGSGSGSGGAGAPGSPSAS